jgi:two-component system, chemotaxis family, sensor kinase CheA
MADDQLQDDALLRDFFVESGEMVQALDQGLIELDSRPEDSELLNRIFRAIHTIKGTSGFFGFDQIVRVTHKAEDLLNLLRNGACHCTQRTVDVLLQAVDVVRTMLSDLQNKQAREYALEPLLKALEECSKSTVPEQEPVAFPAPENNAEELKSKTISADEHVSTMRVDIAKLDNLVNLVGELVLERNRLAQISRQAGTGELDSALLQDELTRSTSRLSLITEELQSASLKTRMVPIDTVFRRFPRMVRDLARQLGKKVDLQITGAETELDRVMVEQIADPLVHLIRNSIDHGLEMPEARQAAGKPETGTIAIAAQPEGDHIIISIKDDGAGIDAARVRQKALEKGLVSAERMRSLSEREILDLIFLPGFSTRDSASDVSGRGVGMDVVNSNLKKVNGTVDLHSVLRQGTTVVLKLPLTMAILPVLFVRSGCEIYGVPMRAVVETLRSTNTQFHWVEGGEVLSLRDRNLPVLRLQSLLNVPATASSAAPVSKVVILAVGVRQYAVAVDDLVGKEETIIKPLNSFFGRCEGIAGTTISGDGSVRLILDPQALLELAREEKKAEVSYAN